MVAAPVAVSVRFNVGGAFAPLRFSQERESEMTQETLRPGELRRQYTEDFFVYAVDFPNLASGGSDEGNIQIQADSDFVWKLGAYFARNLTAGADPTLDTYPVPPITVQIVDSGSGRNLFNQAIPINQTFGTASLPFVLPTTRIFRARSNIQFSVSNDGSDDYSIVLSLIGSKLFNMKQ